MQLYATKATMESNLGQVFEIGQQLSANVLKMFKWWLLEVAITLQWTKIRSPKYHLNILPDQTQVPWQLQC